MAKFDSRQLQYLMGLDEAIRDVGKQNPKDPRINELKTNFYNLAGDGFDRSVLGEIHEHTIEKIIQEQAKDFYRNFPPTIKAELEEAYVSMEHHRRRDHFGRFCEQLFKQIECYSKFIFINGNLLKKVISNRKDQAFSWQQIYNNNGKYENRTSRIQKYGNRIEEIIFAYGIFDKTTSRYTFYKEHEYDNDFGSKFQATQSYVDSRDISVKVRAVLYYLYFNERVEDFQFDECKNYFEDIKAVRNLIHGGNWSAIQIKPEIDRTATEKRAYNALDKRQTNYLIYQGFLANFMTKVSTSSNIKRLSLTI